jgi:hypothetical protein
MNIFLAIVVLSKRIKVKKILILQSLRGGVGFSKEIWACGQMFHPYGILLQVTDYKLQIAEKSLSLLALFAAL